MSRLDRRFFFCATSAVLSALFSFLGWQSMWNAINDPDASRWLVPYSYFSLTVIFLCAFVLSTKKRWTVLALLSVLFATCLFFGHGFILLLVLLIALGLGYIGTGLLAEDLAARIRIDIVKSLRAGLPLIAFAFAIAICGFYYDRISGQPVESLVPRLSFGKQANVLVSKILETVHPGFRGLADDQLTVDEFLGGFQSEDERSSAAGIVSSLGIDPNSVDMQAVERNLAEHPQMRQAALKEARRNLSGIVGRELSGIERMNVVIEEMVNNKIRTYFISQNASENVGLLPFLLTLLLFFTVLPIASLLRPAWIFLTWILFRLAMAMGCIRVVKVVREVERIDHGDPEAEAVASPAPTTPTAPIAPAGPIAKPFG